MFFLVIGFLFSLSPEYCKVACSLKTAASNISHNPGEVTIVCSQLSLFSFPKFQFSLK